MITKEDYIVTAWGEQIEGNGWINTPIRVIVREPSGKLRQECIQPDQQTREMRILFYVSHTVSSQMRSLMVDWHKYAPKPKKKAKR